jgi:hypothetical protein
MRAGQRVGARGRGLALLLLALAGCGYAFTAAGRLHGGAETVAVPPFANRSTEPELGAAIAAALRTELQARGVRVRADAPVRVTGEVTATAPAPAAIGGVSWRFAVVIDARLTDGERLVAERKVRREVDYPAGVDALETEGRRAQAAARLAAEVARELAASLME